MTATPRSQNVPQTPTPPKPEQPQVTPERAAGSRPKPGLYARHHFLLRRLQSLTGILPVGAFVTVHLFTNAQLAPLMFDGESSFQHEVNFIHNLPALLMLEIFGIWLPIAFHAVLGTVYTFSSRPNSTHYPYPDNWRYTLQRVSGILALIFIFLHVATLRWRWSIFGWYTPFYTDVTLPNGQVVELALATTAMALQNVWVSIIYIIGVLSVVFHFANGLWTAAITWGITTSVPAMRRWGYVCTGLFVLLVLFSAAALGGAWSYEPTELEEEAIEYAIANPDAAHSGSAIEEAVQGEEEVTPRNQGRRLPQELRQPRD